jgi:Tol biopolymer transport system component
MGLQTGKLQAATLLSASDGAVMATYRVQRYSPNPAWMASADFPHHSSDILASTYTCVPRNRREWCATEHSLMLINQETQKLLAEGRGATISPTGHYVAAFTKHAVTIYDLATLKRTDVSRYPHPPLFHYAAEDPVGQIVWSTDAKQLIFRTAIDESGHQNVYVVDLSSRRRTKLLNKTSLEIVAWR